MPSKKIAKSPAKSKAKTAGAPKKNMKTAASSKRAKKSVPSKASSKKQAEAKNDETFLQKITAPIRNLIHSGAAPKKKRK